MEVLPVEIIWTILEWCDVNTMLRCSRLNKEWLSITQNVRFLSTILEIHNPQFVVEKLGLGDSEEDEKVQQEFLRFFLRNYNKDNSLVVKQKTQFGVRFAGCGCGANPLLSRATKERDFESVSKIDIDNLVNNVQPYTLKTRVGKEIKFHISELGYDVFSLNVKRWKPGADAFVIIVPFKYSDLHILGVKKAIRAIKYRKRENERLILKPYPVIVTVVNYEGENEKISNSNPHSGIEPIKKALLDVQKIEFLEITATTPVLFCDVACKAVEDEKKIKEEKEKVEKYFRELLGEITSYELWRYFELFCRIKGISQYERRRKFIKEKKNKCTIQ